VAANTESMFWQHRRLLADEVARDFSVTAQSFADTFIQYIAAGHDDESVDVVEHRGLESCALIWAAIEAIFQASAFTEDERMKVVPLVRDTLVPGWRKYRGDSDDFVTRVRQRSGAYLQHANPHSQLKTATAFMNELASNLDAETLKLLPVKTLTALLAHRMISDLRRLNQLKSGHSVT
jgi:hypothetical protein